MGGQACILYGAAEFSRDVDIAVRPSESNLRRLLDALAELRAEPVFVPPLSLEVLLRGHACHFRARVPDAEGVRIDVMAVMHGCEPFQQLWRRRRQLKLPDVGLVNVLALTDLVRAKKTQRDKDWPMVRRLVEVDFHRRTRRPARDQATWWLLEARTAALLVELCLRYPGTARRLASQRPAVRLALKGDLARVEEALHLEEQAIRSADHLYWQPLRAELFKWRRARRKS